MRRFARLSLASAMVATACSLSQFSAEFGQDAGSDAGADTGSDGAPGCNASIFCDDFDDAQPYVKWDDAPPPPGSAISIDTTQSVSAPNSVRLQCGKDRICHLQKTLPKIERMRVDFDVLLVTAPPAPRTIWSFSFDQSDESIEVRHLPDPRRMEFAICSRSGCWAQRDIGDAKDGFHHVRVDVIFGDAGHIDVFVDGTQRITNAQPVPRSAFERGVFYLGNAFADPNAASDIRVDNFAISPL